MSDTLFLSSSAGDSAWKVKLHPVVLFSVLDHYIRRNEGQKRVIGKQHESVFLLRRVINWLHADRKRCVASSLNKKRNREIVV